ncbi:MAG: dihydroorotate dehydrogenase electron transfer subunit [Ruminococcus sp.]|jgi:dihydroorotate dehydrogenase electron transfer subunit|nr:dihydroorotate dehydrogenase electron transfer subunit [Ruminococcus sp.]
MEIYQKSCEVLRYNKLTDTVHDVWVNAPDIAEKALPGQFVNIMVPGFFLRRPISICEVEKTNIRLVFEERGEGTRVLGGIKPGDNLDVLGPLGNSGFSVDRYSSAILVGGGIGTPPLKFAQQNLEKSAAVLGFRSKANVIMAEEFRNATVCTDDGSFGFHGNTLRPLERLLLERVFDVIMACGPKPMLRAVVALADKYNIPSEISLEERMACGAGACLGCACKTVADSIVSYPRVCKDGPVFDGKAAVLC